MSQLKPTRARPTRDPWKKLLSNIKISSRRRYHVKKDTKEAEVRNTREYAITVTPEELETIFQSQGCRCYWLETTLDPMNVFVSHYPFAISADRIDTDQDYTRDNIVITSRFANLGRGPVGFAEFEALLDPVKREIARNVLDQMSDEVASPDALTVTTPAQASSRIE